MAHHIRPLADGDVAMVSEFSLRAWQPVFASFERVLGPDVYLQVYPDWQRSQADDVARACRDDANRTWVCEVDDRPVGFVVLTVAPDASSAEIYMLAVDPEHQRQGIGSALTEFAVEQARAAHVPLVSVGTGGDPGHLPARGTYEKVGFVGLPLVHYYRKL